MRIKQTLELNFKQGEKIKVSPVGDVIGIDGRAYKIDSNVILADISKNGVHIPLDENHDFGEAVGWFDKDSFEVREDGIYASLELNKKGLELVEQKSYRYLSPVYMMGQNNSVVGLDCVGLVNRPNLLNNALNNKGESVEELEKLKSENTTLKGELDELRKAIADANPDIVELKAQMVEMNKKLGLLGGKTDLQTNGKKDAVIEENDKKMAKMLGLSDDEYLKTKMGDR